MRCYRKHKDVIVSNFLALLMGLFMGVSILIIEHTPITWVSLFTIWAKITLVVMVVLMFLPVGEWGERFAEKLGCRPGTIVFKLVENLVPTFIINTVLAAVIPATGIFYNDAIPQAERMSTWFSTFIGGWALTFVISFFFGLLAAKIGKIVSARTITDK